jgi:release factor glutamine methyltransferase
VKFLTSNWFDSVTGPFDMIISNPPYIPNGEIPELMDDVRLFDPLVALDGGCDGLDAYRAIISGAHGVQNEGWLVLECGIDQSDAVGRLLDRYNFVPRPEGLGRATDLGGVVRCVAGKAELAPKANVQKGKRTSNMVNSGRIVPGSCG